MEQDKKQGDVGSESKINTPLFIGQSSRDGAVSSTEVLVEAISAICDATKKRNKKRP